MTVLDVVKVYTTPWWFLVIMGLSFGIFIISIGESSKSDISGIVACVCVVIFVIGLILMIAGVPKKYDHDEYVVEINDETSATEFFKNYEITKTFNYSNAWQVKKKDGVK